MSAGHRSAWMSATVTAHLPRRGRPDHSTLGDVGRRLRRLAWRGHGTIETVSFSCC